MSKNFFAAVLLSIFALVSCSKSGGSSSSAPTPPVNPPVSNPKATIAAQFNTGSEFTTLKAAMNYAGMASVWDATGPYTVLAPDDSAFNSSGLSTAQLLTISPDTVKDRLRYLTLDGKLASSDIATGKETKMISLNGDSVFVTRNAKGVFVNGIRLKEVDIQAGNGLIHVVDGVPNVGGTQGIVDRLAADPDNALLYRMIQRASLGTKDIMKILNSSTVTFLAPNLQAIRGSKYPFATDVNAAAPDSLANFLLDQTFAGRIFGCDLANGTKLTSLTGGTATVSISGPLMTVKGTSGAKAGLFIVKDYMASNGVVHVVDEVLMY